LANVSQRDSIETNGGREREGKNGKERQRGRGRERWGD